MCDTVYAPGSVTSDGIPLFGKNSDRDGNEAQYLLRVPRTKHPAGTTLQCTYIEIPQVVETYEVLLSKPYWIWGAEMGTNEHGVTIGNEAVFSKVPHEKDPGLIGMDLLRLALERAATAREAVTVITSLLEQYGQGGNCAHNGTFYYDNSFLIADPQEAWVLETAGRHWAADRVTGIRTISNGHTIGRHFDLISEQAISYAIERGWCKSEAEFDFAGCYADFVNTTFSRSSQRQCRTTDTLSEHRGAITVETVITVLRDHGPGRPPGFSPIANSVFDNSICAHAGFGPVREYGQSTGSLVSHLAPDIQTHFVTATSAPCTGVFKPVWLGMELPDTGPIPDGTFDEATLWWRHEVLHRATMINYAARARLYASDRGTLETEFVQGGLACRTAAAAERRNYSAECFTRADAAEREWTERVLSTEGAKRRGYLHGRHWDKLNRAANMPELT